MKIICTKEEFAEMLTVCKCCVLHGLCGCGEDENNDGKPADIGEFLKVWGERD